ncbi:hypothetical protein BSKO_07017 [Bryopsis sp. KO-2023]|nr:hypothetical protein BSKO_07017 [Bryopsis sp. KO-2023]
MVFKRVGELWKNVNPFAGSKREREESLRAIADPDGGDRRALAKRSRMSNPGRNEVRPPTAPVPTKIEEDRGVTRRANLRPIIELGKETNMVDANGGGLLGGRISVVRNRVEFGGEVAANRALQEEKTPQRPAFPFVPMERRACDEGPSSVGPSPVQRLRSQNKDDALHRWASIGQKKKTTEAAHYAQVGYVPHEVTRSKTLHQGGGIYRTPPRKQLQNKQMGEGAKLRPGPEKHRFSPGRLPPSVMASVAFRIDGGETTHGEEGSHRPSISPAPITPHSAFFGGEKKQSEQSMVAGEADVHESRAERVSFLGGRSNSPSMEGMVGISSEEASRGGNRVRMSEVRPSSSHRSLEQTPNVGRTENEKEAEEEEMVNSFKKIDLRDLYSKQAKSARQTFGDVEIEREKEKKSIQQSPGLSVHDLEMIEKGADFARASAVNTTQTAKTLVQTWCEFQSSIKPVVEEDEVSQSISDILTDDEDGEICDQPEEIVDDGPRRFGVDLTEADYAVFEDVVKRPDGRVLSGVDNVELTAKVLACLQHGEWLNDEIMNGYMRLMQERDSTLRSSETAPRCHFHKSFFMNRLFLDENRYCYKNVQRWTKPQKLKNWGQQSQSVLDCDIVFFPVHLHMHWVLAYALLGENKIVYCDSLQGKRADVVQAICQYLKDEALDKKGEHWDMSEWEHIYSKNIPRQKNGCDCGVFSLMYAKSRSELLRWKDDWGFDQASMPALRVGMLKEFLEKKLL